MKSRTIHDDFDFCFCCLRSRGNVRLEAAHLRKRSMGQKRYDDRRAVILLCSEVCHPMYDGHKGKINGVQYDPLHFGHGVWMKLKYDEGCDWDDEESTYEYIKGTVFGYQWGEYVLEKGIVRPAYLITGEV